MRNPLILSLLLAAPLAPAFASAPGTNPPSPVRLSLSDDGQFQPGDRARVSVRTEEDGYLLVLRTDVDGWVRVLYPADPFTDNFVRGGQDIDLRDRGGNDYAFSVSRRDGTGAVVAIFSQQPMDFTQFARNDH